MYQHVRSQNSQIDIATGGVLPLRKQAIIDQFKNISQIEYSRHRSPTNFVVHLMAGLLAYSYQEKKPGLHLDERPLLAA